MNAVIDTRPTFSPEQQLQRRSFIGGSEAATAIALRLAVAVDRTEHGTDAHEQVMRRLQRVCALLDRDHRLVLVAQRVEDDSGW